MPEAQGQIVKSGKNVRVSARSITGYDDYIILALNIIFVTVIGKTSFEPDL